MACSPQVLTVCAAGSWWWLLVITSPVFFHGTDHQPVCLYSPPRPVVPRSRAPAWGTVDLLLLMTHSTLPLDAPLGTPQLHEVVADAVSRYLLDVDLVCLVPELFGVTAALAVLLWGVGVAPGHQHPAPVARPPAAWLVVASLGAQALLTLNGVAHHATLMSHCLVVDTPSTAARVGVLVVALLVVAASQHYMHQEQLSRTEYLVVMHLACQGLVLLAMAQDLVVLYLALELQSLSLYVMAAIKRDREMSQEAGLKYFVLGALSSGVLLLGLGLVYAATGTTQLPDLVLLLAGTAEYPGAWGALLGVGVVLLAVGLLFKLAAAPFHLWSPDVYEGAPTSTTAFFMAVPKMAMMLVVVRLTTSLGVAGGLWQPLVAGAALASMGAGALGALPQTRLKRLLAWSSIGHVGFLLAAVATPTPQGVAATVVYLVAYVAVTLVTVALILVGQRNREGTGHRMTYLRDLAYLARSHPLAAATLALALFSMAGIPPLAGFVGKVAVFHACMVGGAWPLAVVGIMASVVSCFYYIRVVRIMYFATPLGATSVAPVPIANAWTMALGMGVLVLLMWYPAPVEVLAHQVARQLCG